MTLAPFVHALGRGPSKSRSLTRAEACEALGLILDGNAEPEAVGALFMLMRYRGENAEEIAGFVDAIHARLSGWLAVDAVLDWPSYAAGRSRGRPWFLLSAKLLAHAGYPVLLHGWNSHQNPIASVRDALSDLDICFCEDADATIGAITRDNIAYVPVEALHPELLQLLKLRDVLGLRSPINTALRALNPAQVPASVQGVFHPTYRALQQDCAALLDQKNLSVIKGGGGEFECNPGKAIELYGLRNGNSIDQTVPARMNVKRRLSDTDPEISLSALWDHGIDDPFLTEIVLGTAALALRTIEPDMGEDAATGRVAELWAARHHIKAA